MTHVLTDDQRDLIMQLIAAMEASMARMDAVPEDAEYYTTPEDDRLHALMDRHSAVERCSPEWWLALIEWRQHELLQMLS